jgi:nucleoside-diphosphate-sugar epimerase
MKTFTILGAGWLGFELAKVLKSKYKIKVSSRNIEKQKIYEEEGFTSYILNENNLNFLDELLDTNYLFINYPPSKFENYLGFLEKIYNHVKIKDIEKIIFISSTSIYPNILGNFDEKYKITDSSSKIVFDAEELIKNKSNIIFRVSALVGDNRYFGKRSANKIVEFPDSLINFVHRNDVISATKFVIENNLT